MGQNPRAAPISRGSLWTRRMLSGIAMQLRIHARLFSTALFPFYVGVLVWGGIYLRDRTLRSLTPLRNER